MRMNTRPKTKDTHGRLVRVIGRQLWSNVLLHCCNYCFAHVQPFFFSRSVSGIFLVIVFSGKEIRRFVDACPLPHRWFPSIIQHKSVPYAQQHSH